MLYPVAIVIGDSDHAYGVVFPDMVGCFSAGDTLEEALSNAKEAAEMYLEDLAERCELPPKASELAALQKNEEYNGFAWAVIEIDLVPYLGESAKINVTLPNLVTKKIDDLIKVHPEYKNRSHFLQVAAMREFEIAAR